MEKGYVVNAVKNWLFVAVCLFIAPSVFGQVGTDKILYENSNASQGGQYSIDQLKTYINTGTGSGTVTGVSVVSANGFSGTVATPSTTPAITIGTTVSGIVFGTGGSIQAAIAANFPTLNQNTTGTAANVTGTVAVANGGSGATTLTGILKGNGTSPYTAATAGTDYVIPSGNITGTSANVTGVIAIANGGTGSATQNFVDLTTNQATIAGNKTFTGNTTTGGAITIANQFNVTPASTSTGATLTVTGAASLIPINSASTTTITVTAGASGNPIIEFPLLSTSTGSVVVQSSASETFNGNATFTVAANSNNYTLFLRKITSTQWQAYVK